jgi:L-ascorbate metabolism protein UlaG (beta-lactamase superfamily)
MVIKKFLHSCILVEENDRRLLIDPGYFSFVEGLLKPEDIGPVDVILLTHEHQDHFYPEAIKKISGKKQPVILGTRRIQALLEQEGIPSRASIVGTEDVGGFKVQTVPAPHEPLPVLVPENVGYLINGTLFHPGDSFDFHLTSSPKVIALPIAGPWMTILQALKKIEELKPHIVIPIHDAIIKDFMLTRMHEMCKQYLAAKGIEFRALALGEELSYE